MNAAELKHRFNLVGVIAAVGALIALIGSVLAYTENDSVTWFDIIVFTCVFLVAIGSIKPSINPKSALFNVFIGILAIVITAMLYIDIADAVEAENFVDVGYGIWLMFIGTFLYTIFCISDFMFKYKQ